MKLPKHIRKKLEQMNTHAQRIGQLGDEIEEWLAEKGFTNPEDYRGGDGSSLEEFEYGTGDVDAFEELLSRMECSCDVKNSVKSSIPEQYQWKRSPAGSASRTYSQVGKDLEAMPLSEIDCPRCRKKALRVMTSDGVMPDFPKYKVGCDACGWLCNQDEMLDVGDAVENFKCWYEAFVLLGLPEDRLHEDLTIEFWPEEERESYD